MPSYREFRFEIDAGYTAETMPLARLTEYLVQLAAVLGEQDIHLVRVESASTVPVFVTEHEAAERVRQRADAVKRGAAPADAMKGYRSLNRMLQEDRGRATFREGSAEIIPFPGADVQIAQPISNIFQQGTIEGDLENVGGPGNWVPVHLRTMAKERISKCFAKKALSEELGHFMYKPVRLYGRGRWGRSADGKWAIERFYIDGFDPLKRAPLATVVANLRRIKSGWTPNPVATLNSLRHGNGEDE